jgi:CO/xanthine dehydrogenase Mo-binding subunit
MPGVVAVVHDGSFLAVAAEREEQAVAAAAQLSSLAEWQELTSTSHSGPDDDTLYEHMLAQNGQRFLVVDGVPTSDAIPALEPAKGAAQTLSATYYRPFLRHASLGPSSAVAHWQAGHLSIWTHSQGVYPLRLDIAQVLGMAVEDIRIIHRDGPGCYGHNGADDVALDAALVARAVQGRPVLLKWTRSQENLWEPFGPAMVMQLQASLDDGGNLLDWSHETKSYSHSARPRPAVGVSSLIAAWHLAMPLNPPVMSPGTGFHGGIHRNADPPYAFPNRRIVKHFLADSPLRHSALRSLGAFSNIFASESFVDEVCAASGADPVEFRLRYLTDPRSQAVVRRAAEKAGWRTQPRKFGRGQGIAFSRYKNTQIYSAVVAEAAVDAETGAVSVLRAVAVADAGRVINPDGLRNQLQGGVIQSASWTLMESVAFEGRQIGGVDWESYPVFRFADAPVVDVELIDRPGEDPLGAGEATVGPASAAIANAIYDAVGVRLRRLPFTPERVRDALAQL